MTLRLYDSLSRAGRSLEPADPPVVRVYGTLSFILLQLIRLGKFLFLVSIPAAMLTGADLTSVIIIVGILIALYTVAGGIGVIAAELDAFHGDPADRILVATAREANARLCTADRRILSWESRRRTLDARS